MCRQLGPCVVHSPLCLTLNYGCNPATSSVQAFQHASSNDGGLNYVNRMQKLLGMSAYFLPL